MRKTITKSQFVLSLVEHLEEQDDLALVDKVQRDLGLDFMNEDDFNDDDLELIAENPNGFLCEFLGLPSHIPGTEELRALRNTANMKTQHVSDLRAARASGFHSGQASVTHAPASSVSPSAATSAVQSSGAMTQAPNTLGGQVQNVAHHAQQGFHNYVQPGLQAVGKVVGGAAHSVANTTGVGHGIASTIAAHPTIAGAAALGLGAVAALRMRKAAKNRAQLRTMGR